MQLARTAAENPRRVAWWSVACEAGVRAPLVGIEVPAEGGHTDQWILANRGIRCFRYRGAVLVAAGPPVPTDQVPGDEEQLRRWLLFFLPQVAVRWSLSPEAVGQVNSTAELTHLLRRSRPADEVPPPAGLTAYEIGRELESFQHGVAELLAAVELLTG